MDREPDLLSDLVRAHWREIHGMLATITRDAAAAEDLAQEVFVLAFRKGLTPGPAVSVWLRRVARYLALNELRKKRLTLFEPSELQNLAEERAADGPASDAASFDERLAALRLCLDQLRDEDRELLRAKYERHASMDDLARTAGQTTGYMKQRMFRLRGRLEECIRRRMGAKERAGDGLGA